MDLTENSFVFFIRNERGRGGIESPETVTYLPRPLDKTAHSSQLEGGLSVPTE